MEEGIKQLKQIVDSIDDNAQYEGHEVISLMKAAVEYMEFELQHQKRLYEFSMYVKNYQNRAK